MVGVLAVGFLCNLAVHPVNPRYHVPSIDVTLEGPAAASSDKTIDVTDTTDAPGTSRARIAVAWITAAIPLLWGVYQTLIKSLALFT